MFTINLFKQKKIQKKRKGYNYTSPESRFLFYYKVRNETISTKSLDELQIKYNGWLLTELGRD